MINYKPNKKCLTYKTYMNIPTASIVKDKIQVNAEEFSLEGEIVNESNNVHEIRIPRLLVVRRALSNESLRPQNGFYKLVCILLSIIALVFFIYFITKKN